MIESLITWVCLNFSIPIFLLCMWLGSAILIWFMVGMEDADSSPKFKEMDTGDKMKFSMAVTFFSPVVLVVCFFMYFFEQGKKYMVYRKEKEKLRREKHYGNEEGMTDEQLSRLGVDNEWRT